MAEDALVLGGCHEVCMYCMFGSVSASLHEQVQARV